jgi:hypothetical protein
MRARAGAAREIKMVMRVAGKEDGEGGKAAMAKKVAGKLTAMATKKTMATKTMEAGKKEGNEKGGKSD